jgi:hypothetical protein
LRHVGGVVDRGELRSPRQPDAVIRDGHDNVLAKASLSESEAGAITSAKQAAMVLGDA